jgi:hypothetical protein
MESQSRNIFDQLGADPLEEEVGEPGSVLHAVMKTEEYRDLAQRRAENELDEDEFKMAVIAMCREYEEHIKQKL